MHRILLIFHFLGLAMGLAAPILNLVLASMMKTATPADMGAFGKLRVRVARVSETGLALLWITGLTMVFRKYGGFSGLPWTFHLKLTAVVVLTVCVALIRVQMKQAMAGDAGAPGRMQAIGTVALLASLTALVSAVVTFAVS